jgi:hypothetical protein
MAEDYSIGKDQCPEPLKTRPMLSILGMNGMKLTIEGHAVATSGCVATMGEAKRLA